MKITSLEFLLDSKKWTLFIPRSQFLFKIRGGGPTKTQGGGKYLWGTFFAYTIYAKQNQNYFQDISSMFIIFKRK